MDPVVDKEQVLSDYAQRSRLWDVELSELNHVEQVFRMIWELEGEVNNGGFAQYYYNAGGDNAGQVGEALREIGAEFTAGLVTQANAVWPDSNPPLDQETRSDQCAELPESADETWERLDEQFYDDRDNRLGLLYDFVDRNRGTVDGFEAAHNTGSGEGSIKKPGLWSRLFGKK